MIKPNGHTPTIISKMSVDTRSRDRSPRPIRHRQDGRYIDNCKIRPRELQIMSRYISGGISEEDLVVLLYFLLASAHLSGHEVEAYSPEIVTRRRLVLDACDKEIIEFLVKSSVETEFGDFVGVIQRRGARRPSTGVLVIVGSVAMMSSSGARGDPVATSSDRAFEDRLVLAFDAQIDRGFFVLAHPG